MVTVSTSRHRSKKRFLSSCCLKIIFPFVSLLSLFQVVAVQYYYAWNSSIENVVVKLNDLAGNPSNADVHQVYDHQEVEVRNYHTDDNGNDNDDTDEKEDQERGLLPNSEHIGAFQNIDRIYYINLDKRKDKRDFMESWLKPFSEKYSIPYQRISAKSWDDSCNNILGGERAKLRCRGEMGLRNSNLHIMDTYNTTGYTLVLEDDFQILNYTRLLDGVKKVPDDWDVIRFDCWSGPKGLNPLELPQFEFGYQTNKEGYCGGTHAALWRSDRLHILRKIWEYPRQIYLGIDCLLSDDNIKSYCVQVKIGRRLTRREFSSDIPKKAKVKAKETR